MLRRNLSNRIVELQEKGSSLYGSFRLIARHVLDVSGELPG